MRPAVCVAQERHGSKQRRANSIPFMSWLSFFMGMKCLATAVMAGIDGIVVVLRGDDEVGLPYPPFGSPPYSRG